MWAIALGSLAPSIIIMHWNLPIKDTVFTQLEAGLLFIKINLQTRLLIVTRLVNEA